MPGTETQLPPLRLKALAPAPRRRKIAFVSSHFKQLGGAEKNIFDLIDGLDRSEFECHLAVLQGGPLLRTAVQKGISVWDLGIQGIASGAAFRRAISFYSFLKKRKIDVVVTYHHDADLWAGPIARLAGVPVISSRRDMGYQLAPKHVWSLRVVNRLFARILTVSNAVAAETAARQWTDSKRICTIYNGVDAALYKRPINRAEVRRSLGLNPDKVTIGMVASFRPVKGQEYFVHAAAAVLERHPDAQFVIVGNRDGDYFRQIEGMIGSYGLKNHIHCPGERSDVVDVIKSLDIFVLSSLHEGFSNALVEAMAAGIPVIAPNSGGNPEAVIHGKTGFLVRPQDPAELAHTILHALDNRPLCETIAANAQDFVKINFSYSKMIERFAALVREVCPATVKNHLVAAT